MKSKILASVTLAVGLLLVSVPLFAHHGGAAYDNTKVVMLAGTVVDFQYINPHCIIHFDVKGSDGAVQHWSMEAPPPSLMHRGSGWYADMIKPGDQITVGLHAARNGSFVGKIAGGNGSLSVNGKPIKAETEE
jgi:hypothetical protein